MGDSAGKMAGQYVLIKKNETLLHLLGVELTLKMALKQQMVQSLDARIWTATISWKQIMLVTVVAPSFPRPTQEVDVYL